jgi:hypothetical protein
MTEMVLCVSVSLGPGYFNTDLADLLVLSAVGALTFDTISAGSVGLYDGTYMSEESSLT